MSHLDAVGPQDRYLLDPDGPSHWDPLVPRQHAAFAVEPTPRRFERFRFGARNRVEIPRSGGHLLSDVTLEIRLPRLRDAAGQPVTDATWAPRIGYVLLRRVRLLVDEIAVDDQERLWYDIDDRLFCPAAHAAGLAEMLGGGETVDRERVVHVPLKLWCCKAHHARRAGLPLLPLHQSTVALEIEAEAFPACVRGPGAARCVAPAELAVEAVCDDVFVDADERQQLLAGTTVVQVRRTQDMDAVNYREFDDRVFPLDPVTVDLSELNHPVAFLAWVAYDESPGAEPFTYVGAGGGDGGGEEAVLLFNGAERFRPRRAAHFALQQRWSFFGALAGAGDDGVRAYAFCLDAGERQPSGAANFAALVRPSLRVALPAGAPARTKVKVFAAYYDWLVCGRGRAAMRFT